ncbi:MAG TPA: hypothetical protein VNM48_09530, partial [Chloroflexota bacterium]|nr:hypothetical protein [Chloroflexota bacterium]
ARRAREFDRTASQQAQVVNMMAVAGAAEQHEKVRISKQSQAPLAAAPKTAQDKTRAGATPTHASHKQPQQQADTRRGSQHQATGAGDKKGKHSGSTAIRSAQNDGSVKSAPAVQEREAAGKKTLLWADDSPGRSPLQRVRLFRRDESIGQARARRHAAAEAAQTAMPRRGSCVRRERCNVQRRSPC